MTPARPLLALSMVAAAGCTVLDTRDVSIALDGPSHVVDTLRVVVTSKGASEILMLVDGRRVGAYPTGRSVLVDVSSVAEGSHQLTASASSAGRPVESEPVEFSIDLSPARVTVTPSGGMQRIDAGFVATVEVEPAPARWRDARLWCGAVPFSDFMAAEQRPGVLAITTTAAAPWDCVLTFSVVLVDGRGRTHLLDRPAAWPAKRAHAWARGWDHPVNGPFYVVWGYQPNPAIDSKEYVPSSDPSANPWGAQLVVNGVPVSDGSLDGATLPEGPVQLGMTIPGFIVDLEVQDQPIVDRTAPVLSAITRVPGQVAWNEVAEIVSNEPLRSATAEWAYVTAGEAIWPPTLSQVTSTDWRLENAGSVDTWNAEAWWGVRVRATDLAGNEGQTVFDFHRAPHYAMGTPEVRVGGVPVVATEVALSGVGTAILSWIGAPGDANAGKVAVAAVANAPVDTPVVIGQGGATSLAASRSQLGWIEATPGGMGAVQTATATCAGCPAPAVSANGLPLNAGDRAASQLTLAGKDTPAATGHLAAWIETDGAGATSLVMGRFTSTGLIDRAQTWTAPGARVSQPSVAVDHREPVPLRPGYSRYNHDALLTWIEERPDASGHVGTATTQSGSINFTPTPDQLALVPAGTRIAGGATAVDDDQYSFFVAGDTGGGWHRYGLQRLTNGVVMYDLEAAPWGGAAAHRLDRLSEGGACPPWKGVWAYVYESGPTEALVISDYSSMVHRLDGLPLGSIRALAVRCATPTQGALVAWVDGDGHIQVRELAP